MSRSDSPTFTQYAKVGHPTQNPACAPAQSGKLPFLQIIPYLEQRYLPKTIPIAVAILARAAAEAWLAHLRCIGEV